MANEAPGDDLTFGSGGSLLQSSVTTGGVGGTQLFSGRRLLLIGRDRVTGGTANDNGHGWYLTSEQFQDAAWIIGDYDSPDSIDGPGPPGSCRQSVPSDNQRAAPAASAIVDGYLYYAQNMVTTAGEPSTDVRGTIRRTNGYTDDSIARIGPNPWNTDTRQANRVVSMLAANKGIYIAVCDKGQAPASENVATNPDWGRILFLDTETNALSEVNVYAKAPAGYARTPYALAYYVGRIFFGGFQSDATENESTISYAQPDLVPILDQKQDTPYFRATCLLPYKGTLYAGFHMRDTGAGVIDFAQVWGRVAAHATPGTSPWTTSLTASGGTAQANNTFVSMVEFKDNLYASYFNNTQTAKIYKFDGTTWTTAYTASAAGTRAQLYLFVDTNDAGTATLYAFGLSESNTMTWLYSTDGATWTDRTTTMETVTPHNTAALFAASLALPVFFGFNQK